MKVFRLAALSGLLLTGGILAASAQSTTVVIQPQEKTVIRKYVTSHPAPTVQVPSGVTIAVGQTIPDSVELTPIQAPDLNTQFDYVVVNGETAIVDPQSRQIVEVIQGQ
ncbi:MAG TPA: DUF1236 domain-containing protein [Pararhizobium sp.]|nr:DUF1236 domain-containing protein [Pararhizobium sp.]